MSTLLEHLKNEIELRDRMSGKEIFDLDDIFRDKLRDKNEKYVCFTGGRGSGKTISIICYMIEQSFNVEYLNCMFLCTREIAGTMDDSVYAVLVDLIAQADLTDHFKILNNEVTNLTTGVRFKFSGLRSSGGKGALSEVNKIKGKHKVAMVFLEEGQDLSDLTLDVLFPTVNRSGKVFLLNRKPEEENPTLDARFFVAMNPNNNTDPIVKKIKTLLGSIVKVNIFDIAKRFQDRQLIAQAKLEEQEPYYPHVWLGEPFYSLGDLPFARMKVLETVDEKVNCIVAFLDPSYKGGDYTALAFLGQGMESGQLYCWGRSYKQSWDSALPAIMEQIKKYVPDRFVYEDNNLGLVPRDLIFEYGVKSVPFTSIHNKEARIYKVGAFIGHKLAMIKDRTDTNFRLLTVEYNMDNAVYDDPPDALASAVITTGIIKQKIKF